VTGANAMESAESLEVSFTVSVIRKPLDCAIGDRSV
jgi:hypothetical protein